MQRAVRLAKTMLAEHARRAPWMEAINEVMDELAEAGQSRVDPEEFRRRVYARVCEAELQLRPVPPKEGG